ncbi:MlrC domain protein [Sinorhizobium meliloti]|nr:MlrC domain protein [Sinorhizobium meliloti]MDX0353376.1 MlrC domain protein [Sinorhizobium meliloti]
MPLRIAIGGIEHETNTFNVCDAQLVDFDINRANAVIDRNQGVRSYLGGMLDAAAAIGATVIPTINAVAMPAGVISDHAYLTIVEELVAEIKNAMPVDAVALALHGAGVARCALNIEVDICQRVRNLVGSNVKIVVTLDLHGNLSPKLSRLVDGAFGTHHHPHVDEFERGQDAINLIPRLLDGTITPMMHVEKLPFLMTPATTMYGTAADLNALCRSAEEDPEIVSCTFFHGFPFADTPDAGASVLTIANGDADKARAVAERVARQIWNSRRELGAKGLSPEEAVRRALRSKDWPVAVLDGGDDPGGGCPGDGTFLLRAMIEAGVSNACFAVMYDSSVVMQAYEAGIGSTIEIELGGKTDTRHGAPVAAKAYIKTLTDGRYVRQSPMGRGSWESLGRTVRLQIGGIDVIVLSQRDAPSDPGLLLLHGIDVSRYRIIGLKSTNHWRAGFAGLIKADYLADSPGLMSRNLTSFCYHMVRRPIWPLEKNATY